MKLPLPVSALVGLLLTLFLASVEATVLSTAMPTIVKTLGGRELYPWAFSAFMLASTVTTPFYGKWADRLGVKPCILVAVAFFLGGSLLCSLAHNMMQLIAARLVQGAGSGGIIILTMIAFGQIFAPEVRGRMQSLISLVWGVASLTGPLMGGWIVTYWSWQWIFWINLPMGIISTSLFWRAFPSQVPHSEKVQIDWWGSLGLFVGLLSLMLALTVEHSLGKLGYGVALATALLLKQHWQRIEHPLIPLVLFRVSLFRVTSGLGFGASLTMFAALTYVPLYVQEYLHHTPIEAGTVLTPMMLAWPLASTFAGFWLNRWGFRRLTVLGAIAMVLGYLSWSLFLYQAPLWLLSLLGALMGTGMGMITATTIVAVQVAVAPHQVGIASSTLSLFRNIGSAVGVSALGSLQWYTAKFMPLSDSIRVIFVVAFVVGLLCLWLSWHVPPQSPLQLSQQQQ